MAKTSDGKKPSTKKTVERLWRDDQWVVNHGSLVRPPGRPGGVNSLFKHVAEKIPYEALDDVRKTFQANGWRTEGVYIAHDSMGFARYVGRGKIFARLKARLRQAPHELKYFSFYVIANKNHEREIETLMIRLGGAHLLFNSKKKRVDTSPGNVRDYEPGTRFVERRRRPGPSSR